MVDDAMQEEDGMVRWGLDEGEWKRSGAVDEVVEEGDGG